MILHAVGGSEGGECVQRRRLCERRASTAARGCVGRPGFGILYRAGREVGEHVSTRWRSLGTSAQCSFAVYFEPLTP